MSKLSAAPRQFGCPIQPKRTGQLEVGKVAMSWKARTLPLREFFAYMVSKGCIVAHSTFARRHARLGSSDLNNTFAPNLLMYTLRRTAYPKHEPQPLRCGVPQYLLQPDATVRPFSVEVLRSLKTECSLERYRLAQSVSD